MPYDDPKRVYAIVVGIESHPDCPAWNLKGPRNDAIRFASTLNELGKVPWENIHLAVDRKPWSEEGALPLPQANIIDPTSRELYDLIKKVGEWKGTELVIFWGGHGICKRSSTRRFVAKDAKSGDIKNLDFNAILEYLGSDNIPASRFATQTFICDTCAEDIASFAVTPPEGFPTGKPIPDGREQVVLYATRPGQLARNDGKEQTGFFSRELAGRFGTEWPPNMTQVADELSKRFKKLRAQGFVKQDPTFLQVSNKEWTRIDFRSERNSKWLSDAELERLVNCVLPSGDLLERGKVMFEREYSEIVLDPESDWYELFDLVGARAYHERPDILPFVIRLQQLATGQVGESLEGWVKQYAKDRALAVPNTPPLPDRLLLVVFADEQPGRFQVGTWRWRPGWDIRPSAYTAGVLRETDLDLGDAFLKLKKHVLEITKENISGNTILEFIVPEQVLRKPFHLFEGPPSGRFEPRLGSLWPIVVRPVPDHRNVPRQARLQSRITSGDTVKDVMVLDHGEAPETLYEFLMADLVPHCYGLASAPEEDQEMDALAAAVGAGVTALVWFGSEHNLQIDQARHLLATALTDKPFQQLPQIIFKQRKEAVRNRDARSWKDAVLLIDDPDRFPGDVMRVMSSPKATGQST